MLSVTVRFPEEFVAYVRRLSKQRRVEEATIWRELVATGIQRTDTDDGLSRTAFNLTIQTLCLTRRMAGHLDEELLELAKEDAKHALEQIGVEQQ